MEFLILAIFITDAIVFVCCFCTIRDLIKEHNVATRELATVISDHTYMLHCLRKSVADLDEDVSFIGSLLDTDLNITE